MAKIFFLILTSAVALAGIICRAGKFVEVDEPTARNLLHRGKARLATPEEIAAAGHAAAATDDAADGKGAPTRDDLDKALAEVEAVAGTPGGYKDPDYVVAGMRTHFGALLTADDEARIRELFKPGKPSDGLTVAQLKEALAAKNVTIPKEANTKAELAALLDGAAGSATAA